MSDPARESNAGDIYRVESGAGSSPPGSAATPPPPAASAPPPPPASASAGGEPGGAEEEEGSRAIAQPGWLTWEFSLGVGATLLVVSALLSAARANRAGESWLVGLGSGALWTPVDALMGLGALALTARLAERPVGSWRLAAARMLASVALARVVVLSGVSPTGWPVADGALALGLAVGVYWLCVLVAFRMGPRDAGMLLAWHAGLWLVARGLLWLLPRIFAGGAAEGVAPPAPAPTTAPAPAPSAAPVESLPGVLPGLMVGWAATGGSR